MNTSCGKTNTLKSKVIMLCSLFHLLVICLSTTMLHYHESIENEGLAIFKIIDTHSNNGDESQEEANDNDNETVRVLADFNLRFSYSLLNLFFPTLETALPRYNKSYDFALISELIKPPIAS
jgi:hypothetical protein